MRRHQLSITGLLATLAMTSLGWGKPITLGEAFHVDPETLELLYENDTLSHGSDQHDVFHLEQTDGRVRWAWEDAGLTVDVSVPSPGVMDIRFEGHEDVVVNWPNLRMEKGDMLAIARDSGLFLSPSDSFWRERLVDEKWDTLEGMSIPVWGFINEERCVSWMISTPFRNTLSFTEPDDNGGGLELSVSHHFHPKSASRDVTYRVVIDENFTPVTPGLRYREWLDELGHVTTLAEKQELTPKVERLLGAPHLYLWDSGIVTRLDIKPQAWKPFCEKLIEQSKEEGSLAARLREAFTEEQWESVVECPSTEWPFAFMKQQIADGLSNAVSSTEFSSSKQTLSERIEENITVLTAGFPEVFLPVNEWGNGASVKMLEALDDLGFENLRLCLPGWEFVDHRPWVASVADEKGWLFGTYDSYHSIHDPKYAGKEGTWITAQMTQELWEGGGVMNADGSYRKGFQGKGRKLNPLVARPFYEQRISENLQRTPFNSYFMDCDAYGEVYDDYHPEHSNSAEEDAAERTRRLGWLSKEKGLVVGSEGGNVYSLEGVHFLEGIFGPYFGWGDEDMADRKSEYYRGAYYPPDQPAVYFKPIPLKTHFQQERYDPTVRIPLFQAAFHDAVVTTHHWSNGHFKYPDLTGTIELLEILWMCPPMAHMNMTTLKERGPDLKAHYESWAPIHKELGFAKLTGFRYLSDDKTVQETTWENGTSIVANFGDEDWEAGQDKVVEGGSFEVR